MKFALLIFLFAGCVERQELREQHCAQLAIAHHGYLPPVGVYGTWTKGPQCYGRLWDHVVTFEGVIADDGAVVFDLGPNKDQLNDFRCLGKCHGLKWYDVKVSSDHRYCFCKSDKLSD